MKLQIKILIAVMALCSVSCSQSGYNIKGQFGKTDGRASLAFNDPVFGNIRDTVAMNSGSFAFAGEASEPISAVLSVIPEGESPITLRMVVENGRIKLDLHPEDVIEASHNRHSISNPKVTGTPNNDFVTGEVAVKDKVGADPRFKAVHAAYTALHRINNTTTPEYEAQSKKYKADFADIIPAYEAALDSAMVAYALAHPDVEIAAQVFRINGKYLSNEEYEAGYNSFTPAVQESPFADGILKKIQARKSTEPGSVAPDFTLKNPEGQDVTLSSFRGQYVLLDFWASWCVPCRKSMPSMKEIYAKYHDKGFEIIGISNDNKVDAWKKAIEEDQTPWVHTIDEFPGRGETAIVIGKYRVPSLPTYILLDKEGVVVATLEHEDIEPKLAGIFGE